MCVLLRRSTRCLFGAGITLGGVRSVIRSKVDLPDWTLQEGTRRILSPLYNVLVMEYFLRLNKKRVAVEADGQNESMAIDDCDLSCERKSGAIKSKTSALNMARWNSMYRHELETAQVISQLMLQLDDNVALRDQLRSSDKVDANNSDGGVAELLALVDEETRVLLRKLSEAKLDVDNLTRRRLDAEDVVATSTNTWQCNVTGRAGGEEAGLFATELAEMYKVYARESLGLSVCDVDLSATEMNGHTGSADSSRCHSVYGVTTSPTHSSDGSVHAMMHVSGVGFRLVGKDVYRHFQHEIGVHKVQRIPVTDAVGKMQTSTAVFTMMPVLDPVSVDVLERDCKIDFVRGSGPGGQGMQSSSNCVVLTHKPSGISVKCHQSRSALANKEIALQLVAQQILARRSSEQSSSLHNAWQNQWCSGERSEKMRTYNFPQNRVTDHRLRKDYPLSTFMDRGRGLKAVHDELNDIKDNDRLNSVFLKHIRDNFSGTL